MKDAAAARALCLRHIGGAIQRIRSYTAAGKKAFLADTMLQDAVIRNLEIVGEAVRRLDEKSKHARPEVPWREIAGMRDRLIHGYFDVNLEIVWATVKKDLPALAAAVTVLQRRNTP